MKTIDQVCKTAPKAMVLTFEKEPESATQSPPDPNKGQFVAVYGWLIEQRRYVEEQLTPLGDRAADNRRLALFGKLNGEIARLDEMKKRAWNKHVGQWLVRKYMSGQAGPLFVETGRHQRMIL